MPTLCPIKSADHGSDGKMAEGAVGGEMIHVGTDWLGVWHVSQRDRAICDRRKLDRVRPGDPTCAECAGRLLLGADGTYTTKGGVTRQTDPCSLLVTK